MRPVYLHGVLVGYILLERVLEAKLPTSELVGQNKPGTNKSASPYRNLAHWLRYRTPTKTQRANDEPPNFDGPCGTGWGKAAKY